MIKIFDINMVYGKEKVLDNITLSIKKEKVSGIIGGNGAGKSTLLAILSTTLKPDSGQIFIDGLSYDKNKDKLRNLIGYVAQESALFEELSVKDNLCFWGNLSGLKMKDILEKDIIIRLDLNSIIKKKVRHLSAGLKQRVNIAISLLSEPEIIILDEPTSGLDLISKKQIYDMLKEKASQKKTIIYTSHDFNEISKLCDAVYILNKGKIIELSEEMVYKMKNNLVNFETEIYGLLS